MDPLIKSQLLYQLSYAPVQERRAGGAGFAERPWEYQKGAGMSSLPIDSPPIDAPRQRDAGGGQPWVNLPRTTRSDHSLAA